jgi:hypothetical protein
MLRRDGLLYRQHVDLRRLLADVPHDQPLATAVIVRRFSSSFA